jgi:hypothetical protein
LDSLLYLVEIYWPYALGVLAIGLVAGWFAPAPKR